MERVRGQRGCVRYGRGIAGVSAWRDGHSATTLAVAGEGSPENNTTKHRSMSASMSLMTQSCPRLTISKCVLHRYKKRYVFI